MRKYGKLSMYPRSLLLIDYSRLIMIASPCYVDGWLHSSRFGDQPYNVLNVKRYFMFSF